MSYWDSLYSRGGNSGGGSVGAIRDWKWKTLSESGADMDRVIDFGCGDLSFWDGKGCSDYTGIEQSESRCRQNRVSRPDLPCFCADASYKQLPDVLAQSPTVICFDVLFRVMDTKTYIGILENLSASSSDYIFIYTWWRNPFTNPIAFITAILAQLHRGNYENVSKMLETENTPTDFQYQYYSPFCSYAKYLTHHKFQTVLYPPIDAVDPYGAMYIFRRRE